MVVIRLSRTGAKKNPFYHVVAADKRNPRDGRFLEKLGRFNPVARGQEVVLDLNQERITYWLGQGAQFSERVEKLYKQFQKVQQPIMATTTAKELKEAQMNQSAATTAKAIAAADADKSE